MGMYSDFYLKVRLVKPLPEVVKRALREMEVGFRAPSITGIDHPFFQTQRWNMVWRGSYVGEEFDEAPDESSFKNGTLTITSAIKNYENEYQKFMDWLSPYVAEQNGAVVGKYQYEEDDEPTSIIFRDGKLRLENK